MRARAPDVSARSSATASRSATSGYGDTVGRATGRRSCCCRPGRSSTPASGSCRCRTSPATSPSSCTTDRATAAPSARPIPAATRSTPTPHDAAAVLDECGVERAVVVGAVARRPATGCGSPALRPELVAGLVLDRRRSLPLAQLSARPSSARPLPRPGAGRPDRLGSLQPRLLARPLRRVRQWFFEQVFSEPHSTKAREDAVGVGAGDRDAELLGAERAQAAAAPSGRSCSTGSTLPDCSFVHGTDDRVAAARRPPSGGPAHRRRRWSRSAGAGHLPNLRDPVRFNLLLREFAERVAT